MTQPITNTDRVALLLQPFLTTQDLMAWYGRGKSWVGAKLRDMHEALINEGKKVLRGTISTAAFMRIEGIDLEEYVAKAKIEKELGI